MSTKFYNSIIEEERKTFNVKIETLKQAAKDVSKTYSPEALQTGSATLDYNNASNRCAYLFKYGTLHSELVFKYFKKLADTKEFKKTFKSKKEIRICSLGGGPGTDVVGIIKALAMFPSFHQKIVQISVLDLEGGWRNSFKHVIESLKHGHANGVPASFFDSDNFKSQLISVNLLNKLPENISKIISSADIVSMVKFVSAVLGAPRSLNALKVIGNTIKPDATVFFVDNFQGKVFQPLENMSKECGFHLTLGPLHEVYVKSLNKIIIEKKKKPKDVTYGCTPANNTRVSVIGWIKTPEDLLNSERIPNSKSTFNDNEDDVWDTESESEDSKVNCKTKEKIKTVHHNCKTKPVKCKDKFTQTNIAKYLSTSESEKDQPLLNGKSELVDLMSAISDLLSAMEKLEQNSSLKICSCKC